MAEQLGDLTRTHTCGALRPEDVGADVVLLGWVHRVRDLGGLLFIDVRDRAGVTQIVFDTDDPLLVFASVEVDHLWRSTDGGGTWSQQSDGLQSADIHGVSIIEHGGRTLFASSNAGLHVSRDDGGIWVFQRIDSPWQYVRAIVARSDRSGILFTTNGNGAPGSEGRLYRSRDFGATWEDAGLPGQVQSSLYFLAYDRDDPMLLFASTSLGQFYRSLDGGETWSELPRRLGEIRALHLVPT